MTPIEKFIFCLFIITFLTTLWQQGEIDGLRNMVEVRTARAIDNDLGHEKRYTQLLEGEAARLEVVKNCLESQTHILETQDYILGIINLKEGSK